MGVAIVRYFAIPVAAILIVAALVFFNTASKDQTSVDWLGTYEFRDTGEPGSMMTIEVLSGSAGELTAILKIKHKDATETLRCSVKLKKSLSGEIQYAQFVFVEALGAKQSQYQPGDWLLSFEMQGGTLFTRWGRIHPRDEQHQIAGAWFRKIQ